MWGRVNDVLACSTLIMMDWIGKGLLLAVTTGSRPMCLLCCRIYSRSKWACFTCSSFPTPVLLDPCYAYTKGFMYQRPEVCLPLMASFQEGLLGLLHSRGWRFQPHWDFTASLGQATLEPCGASWPRSPGEIALWPHWSSGRPCLEVAILGQFGASLVLGGRHGPSQQTW